MVITSRWSCPSYFLIQKAQLRPLSSLRTRSTIMCTLSRSPSSAPASLSVAVVGAGAAGLVAARELLREGHRVTIYEKSQSVGGVWQFTDEIEDDPLGATPSRRLHNSMYAGLRTNLPREVMGYSDFPFDDKFPGSNDPRRFCSHQEVLTYLEAFARHFDLEKWVKFGTVVSRVAPLGGDDDSSSGDGKSLNGRIDGTQSNQQESWPGWEVASLPIKSNSSNSGSSNVASTEDQQSSEVQMQVEYFDAVVVCNGHYSEPRTPHWPGQDVFPGLQMHSHNYRHPKEFIGKTVVVIGAAFSGTDIAQELVEGGATQVYLSARTWVDPSSGAGPDDGPGRTDAAAAAAADFTTTSSSKVENAPNGGTVNERISVVEKLREPIRVGNVQSLNADGSVLFDGGIKVENVDIIMYATGYRYHFPFLQGTPAAPNIDDNRVGPLYGHVFPLQWAPSLSFIGLPWKVVPFPQFELQSKWIARCLSGKSKLPPPEEMLMEIEGLYASLEKEGVEKRYTHRMAGEIQGKYNRWLAQMAGKKRENAGWPEWRSALYSACGASRRANGLLFRELPLVGAEKALEEAVAAAEEMRAAQGIVSATAAKQ